MNVVLVEPEIPPNTGNVARLCAATASTLHLIEPFGFKLDDSQLKRAGMDYWQHVTWHRWPSWSAFQRKAARGRPVVVHRIRRTAEVYTEVAFAPDDYLVFGRETAGLPKTTLGGQPGKLAADSDVQPQGPLAESFQLRGAGPF